MTGRPRKNTAKSPGKARERGYVHTSGCGARTSTEHANVNTRRCTARCDGCDAWAPIGEFTFDTSG